MQDIPTVQCTEQSMQDIPTVHSVQSSQCRHSYSTQVYRAVNEDIPTVQCTEQSM